MNGSGDRRETLRGLKFFAAIGLTFLALAAGAGRADALTSESGDFVQEVERLKTLAFAKDSGLYVAPSAAERAAFATLAATLLAGDLAAADTQAAALDYELVAFTDLVSGAVYHGLREAPQTRGWGAYFLDLDYGRDALVESPHILFDTNSWEVAALAFRQSGARGFLMSGAHRNANGQGTADVAHLTDSIFQVVHQAWNGPAGETTAWQIHGFNLDNHGFPAGTDGVLSNGDGGVTQEVIDLDGLLEAEGFLSHAYNTLEPSDPVNLLVNDGEPGTTFSSLAGTTNVQGIHSRGLGGVFVHVELEQSIRFDAQNRVLAAGAIADAILADLDTTAPMVLGATALDATSVQVDFTEPLDQASATAPGNYAIDNDVVVSLAVLSGDGRSVILDTSTIAEGVIHWLTVNAVEDLAGNPVAPDSQAQFELLAPLQAHVAAIDMTLVAQGGKWRRARARVWIVDDGDGPVGEAAVSGTWSGLTSQNASGLTGSDGSVLFESDRASGASGQFVFTVGDVAAAGYAYDPGANGETNDCITIAGQACGGGPGPGGGTGVVRGLVKDQSGAKLAGATVDADGNSDQTSRGGRYRIDQVSAGEAVEVTASVAGCAGPVSQTVAVAADQTVTVDFTGSFALQCN
jgi:hypothetical protein